MIDDGYEEDSKRTMLLIKKYESDEDIVIPKTIIVTEMTYDIRSERVSKASSHEEHD